MIVQTFVVILTLSVALIIDVNGTSFSNVYVESEVAPMGYYSYGTPYPLIANPRLSQINSLPTVHGYVGPCVSPCVYPAQTVTTVTPGHPSPNVLTNAPSSPVIVAPTNQEATGYEYSYVVYDQNTGDHKAQRELSDGSVVRGEYSFLQPDGYIREVQYVADDVSGFNAVVKKFLPVGDEGNKKGTAYENKASPPCPETKNESLKEGSEENSGEITMKELKKSHEQLHRKQSNEESAVKKERKSKEHHGNSKQSEEEENSKEKHNEATKEVSGEVSVLESDEKISQTQTYSKEASGERSKENSKEKQHIKPSSEEESDEETNENSKEENHDKSKESAGESEKRKHKKINKESIESEEDSEETFESEESKEELKEKSPKKSSKETEASKNKLKKESKELSDEDSVEESDKVGSGKHKEAHELLKPSTEAVVPYKDILRCIEAAMKRNYGVPTAMRQEPSPLTYIVLNKPC